VVLGKEKVTFHTVCRPLCFSLSKLNVRELNLIGDVLNKLADMNAFQISEYSHNDVPWMTTEEGDVIDYESIFYRTTLFSEGV